MKMTRRLSAYVLHSLPPISPPRHTHTHINKFFRSRILASCVCVEKVFAVLTLRHSNNNNKTVRRTWKIVFDLNFVVGFFRVFLAVHIKDLSKQTLTKHLFSSMLKERKAKSTHLLVVVCYCCCLTSSRERQSERESAMRGGGSVYINILFALQLSN